MGKIRQLPPHCALSFFDYHLCVLERCHPRYMLGNDKNLNHCLRDCDLGRNFLKMLERRFDEFAIQLHIAEGVEVADHVLLVSTDSNNLPFHMIL